MLRVTVCEMHDDRPAFAEDWARLVDHARAERSDLVVLPEMPFAPWLAASPTFDAAAWDSAVHQHDAWLERLVELAPATVIASRPVTRSDVRLNEGFVWTADRGCAAVHHKRFLPDEAGYWEAKWYARGEDRFDLADAAGARVGLLICTELWSMAHAQSYGQRGMQLLVTPRATGRATVEKWIVGGRAAAIVSGAYSVSSNWTAAEDGGDFGGAAWVIDPDGVLLARTSRSVPFATVAMDPATADAAKRTYPRYAL